MTLMDTLVAVETLAAPLPEPTYITIIRGRITGVSLMMSTVRDVEMWRRTLTGMPGIEESWVDDANIGHRYIFVYRGIEFDVYTPQEVVITIHEGE